jgi:hypothetical protein
VCGGLNGAVWWRADLDIDCDGARTAQCNETTDPWFQNQTAMTDSQGEWLDASTLPYVVVPLSSWRFDYESVGLQLGSVVAVIYNGRLEYGIIGDLGPEDMIGEASYAMAERLGIDPDPATGGAAGDVVFIAFTGGAATVSVPEDHGEAVDVGEARARAVVDAN